ncbi:MAG: alkaline phosphatase family protein [Firmicutes bacterium]|nr:alkaline phosphatase family protein [Bacillota bacterium]
MREKKIVYINLDGFSYSYFEQLKKNGGAQGFCSLAQEGILFKNLRSGLVSITNPMQCAILSGAWSNKTHNFYQHYDPKTREVVKHYRTFDAENIAEVFIKNNKKVVSIHQFMLENNPCMEGEFDRAYIKSAVPRSTYADRFAILKKLVLKEPVKSGEEYFVYNEFPDFVALYVDDLDALGHNCDYDGYPRRHTPEERYFDIEKRLKGIETEIVSFVSLCKAEGIYGQLLILITTDHGMTPFFGKSKLPDLIREINALGIKTDTPDTVDDKTQVVALPYTIECSLYYQKPLSAENEELLTALLNSLDYIDKVFTKSQMVNEYGFDERGPQFLLSPKYGMHFYHRDLEEGYYGASHDSFDETSQHIFGLLLGESVLPSECNERVYAIDLLPGVLKHACGLEMKDATGRIFENWFR